ncbi:MAG: hypothetical protein ACLTMP_09945 [Eggerthella lenta]
MLQHDQLNPLLWKKTNKPKTKDVGKIGSPQRAIERLSGRQTAWTASTSISPLLTSWRRQTRDIYDLLKQGIQSRDQPLYGITTNRFVRQNIFDSQYEYAEK